MLVKEEPKRRSQAERSDAMRKRLLAATLASLVEDGYVGTTLSSVVRRAGVSRGAQVHHYPNKQALIVDTAEYLVRRTYRTLGEVVLSVVDENNRLQALTEACWKQLFDTSLYRAYSELLIASQRDEVLAEALRALMQRVQKMFEAAAEHYFVAAPHSKVNVAELFLQLCALMAGLGSQAHLLDNEKLIQSQLNLWLRHAKPLIQARKGIKTAPSRPVSF